MNIIGLLQLDPVQHTFIQPELQCVQNALARTVMMMRKHDHITPMLANLHWLAITARIQFKTAPLTFKTLTTHQPSYISRPTPAAPLVTTTHVLRSQPTWNSSNENPAQRSSTYSAPHIWHLEHSIPCHHWQLECYSKHFQEETENVLLH